MVLTRRLLGQTDCLRVSAAVGSVTENETVPIQSEQFCRAGHFQCLNIDIFFKENIRKQFYQTALGNQSGSVAEWLAC